MLSALPQNTTAKGYRVFITLNGVVTSNLPYYVAPDFDGEHNFYLHGIHYIVVWMRLYNCIFSCAFVSNKLHVIWRYVLNDFRLETLLSNGKKKIESVIFLTKRIWHILVHIPRTIAFWNVRLRRSLRDVDVRHGLFLEPKICKM